MAAGTYNPTWREDPMPLVSFKRRERDSNSRWRGVLQAGAAGERRTETPECVAGPLSGWIETSMIG